MLKFFKKKLSPGSMTLHVGRNFHVGIADYATTGERDAILASSGMGKSYLTGVLIEQTMEVGGMVCIIDPEGEHFTLAGRYPMMIIGGEQGNLPLEEDALDLYIEAMLKNRISAVFDLSEHTDQEQQHLYAVIADHLFKAEQKYRLKVRLVVEEAQIYAPQRMAGTKNKKGFKDPVEASQKIAKRGRKRAIDSLWATQRPASLNKDILSQCNRFWFGGITSEQDYKAIKPFLNEAGISFAEIKALEPGQFYFYSKGQTTKIKVRKRICKHAGATPEIGLNFNPTANHTLDEALSKLADVVAKRAFDKKKEDSEIARLKAVVKELEAKNRKLEKELQQEQMATKVIERLGSKPTSGQIKRAKKSATKHGHALPDDDPLDQLEPPGPEKILVGDDFVPEGGHITSSKSIKAPRPISVDDIPDSLEEAARAKKRAMGVDQSVIDTAIESIKTASSS